MKVFDFDKVFNLNRVFNLDKNIDFELNFDINMDIDFNLKILYQSQKLLKDKEWSFSRAIVYRNSSYKKASREYFIIFRI